MNSEIKKTVITGCAGGIGSETCRYFQEKGWYVIGIDKNPTGLSDRFYRCDLERDQSIEEIFSQITKEHPSIDALVNNAAISLSRSLMETELNEWRRVLDVNVTAPFLVTKYLVPSLAQAHGSVVNVSSIIAKQTTEIDGAYATTKGALLSLTRALALELAHYNIRVNSILPGAIKTKMLTERLRSTDLRSTEEALLEEIARKIPLNRIGFPKDIAAAIYFLCDRAQSSFITGQELVIDGGVSARLSNVERK